MNDRTGLLGDASGNSFWGRRTKKEKGLIIAGIAAFLAVIILVIVLTSTKSHDDTPATEAPTEIPPTEGTTTGHTDTTTAATTTTTTTTTIAPPGPEPHAVCETEVCYREAAAIRSNMNASTDPCEDFYAFACGNFSSTHKIPKSSARYNNFDAISEIVSKRLSDVFSQSVDKEAAPLAFVRKVFNACNDTQSLDKDGLKPLQSLTNDILKAKSWPQALTRAIVKTGVHAIFSLSVQANAFNSTQYVINLDQPEFGVSRNELVNETDESAIKIKNAYTKLVAKSVKLLFNSKDEEKDANAIVAFETQLAQVAASPVQRRDVVKMTQLKIVSDFKKQVPYDWISLVNDVLYQTENFNGTLQDDDILIVNDWAYFQQASLILKQADAKTIQMYIAWRLAQTFGFLSTNEVRSHEFEFDKIREGIKEPHIHQTVLTDKLVADVPSLIGRLYVDAYFSDKDKKAAKKLIVDTLAQYRRMLGQAEWLGDKSKKEALAKIDSMQVNVGFPDWIRKDDVLESMYQFKDTNSSGLQLYLELRRVRTAYHFKRLSHSRVDKDKEWPMSPALVNAAYEPSQNSITFPAAILQGVFFDAHRPAYLNYGGIGSVIGHEISHGFDDQGAKYDHEGNLNNWWGKEAQDKFNEKADCFVQEYGSVFVESVEMNLNGNNTLGENIADNGGIHQSLEAYSTIGEEALLPGLDYDQQQLYFLSNANIWCGLIRTEELRNRILTDPHSPAKYRVNVPFSNSERFADSFKCPTGSPMNPPHEEKCELW